MRACGTSMRKPWTTNSGGDDDGLYKSTDGGKTWTKLTGHGLPTDTLGRIGLAVAPSNGDAHVRHDRIEAGHSVALRRRRRQLDDGEQRHARQSTPVLFLAHRRRSARIPITFTASRQRFRNRATAARRSKSCRIQPHGDFHGMWIAPNDPDRMIVAEDGGIGRSLDGGNTWFFGRNLPVGEVYHVGVGAARNPYWVCGGWQDNNAWCGAAFSTDPSGEPEQTLDQRRRGRRRMGRSRIRSTPTCIWADSQDGFD